MHCSRKISNRNSLQFCRYRCLNVAYVCILVPLQLHFKLRICKIVGPTQIRRLWGIVKSFAWTMLCSRCSAVNACGTNRAHSFCFSMSSDRFSELWFLVSHTLCYHPTTSTAVVFQNSYLQSIIFVRFCCSQPSVPLCIFNLFFTRHRLTMPSKYCSTRHRRVTKCFYKDFQHFHSVNLALQQNFIVARCLKLFSMVIYNRSTEHKILQNALILPHTDRLTSNLVCRWRRV